VKKDLYLKKKKFEINNLKSEIAKLDSGLKEIEKSINKKNDLYKSREKLIYNTVIETVSKNLFLSNLLKEVEILKKKKELILYEYNQKKRELSKLLGEKRAYEKYIDKKVKQQKKIEDEKENQYANEIFIRKFYNQ